ncbi:uncharacterized protein EAF01_001670 [Botrytis porri]|uniref:Uncharacterized protein n=1 Tax=Botrytis porri TaxID=87229 RepID=A0A4Z1L3B1_9HELO|nr:uncharacterized protein EAF01_001670 [Botrytis porri]KAF7912649.1 hypothetical protein EAF01_001670 [Botrytis porri]TGO91295.1 hypothetical protein BPOR_0032g00150 [Botrytis porri]
MSTCGRKTAYKGFRSRLEAGQSVNVQGRVGEMIKELMQHEVIMQDLKTGAYARYDDKAIPRGQDAKQRSNRKLHDEESCTYITAWDLVGSTRVDQEKIVDTTFTYKAHLQLLSIKLWIRSHGIFKAKVTDGTDQQLNVLSRRAEQGKSAVIDETRSRIHFRNSRILIDFRGRHKDLMADIS